METTAIVMHLKKTVHELLKPCPFCGGKDIAYKIDENPETGKPKPGTRESFDRTEYVKCLTCGATVKKALGVNAVIAWNERH